MTKYTTSMTTPWPPDKAFAYLADVRNFAEWDPGVVNVDAPIGQVPSVGAAYDVAVKTGPRSMTLRYEVLEFEAPARLLLRARTRTLLSVDEIRVRPGGAGSIVTYDAELTLRGTARIFAPMLALAFGRIGDRAAAGLARELDAQIADAS